VNPECVLPPAPKNAAALTSQDLQVLPAERTVEIAKGTSKDCECYLPYSMIVSSQELQTLLPYVFVFARLVCWSSPSMYSDPPQDIQAYDSLPIAACALDINASSLWNLGRCR